MRRSRQKGEKDERRRIRNMDGCEGRGRTGGLLAHMKSGRLRRKPKYWAPPFWRQSPIARFCIIAAGPVFNFILAYVLAVVILSWAGYDAPVLVGVDGRISRHRRPVFRPET